MFSLKKIIFVFLFMFGFGNVFSMPCPCSNPDVLRAEINRLESIGDFLVDCISCNACFQVSPDEFDEEGMAFCYRKIHGLQQIPEQRLCIHCKGTGETLSEGMFVDGVSPDLCACCEKSQPIKRNLCEGCLSCTACNGYGVLCNGELISELITQRDVEED